MIFTFEEIQALIESEPEYPTPWPADQEKKYHALGVTRQMAAQAAVACTKKTLIKRLTLLRNSKI